MVNYNGDYKLSSTENFDEYMKAVGVSMLTRKAAASTTPVLSITVSGDHWVIKQASTFKNHTQEFDIGVAQDITTPDGRKVKATVTKAGDVLTEKQTGDGKDATIVRTFTDAGIDTVCSAGGVVCKRNYSRQ